MIAVNKYHPDGARIAFGGAVTIAMNSFSFISFPTAALAFVDLLVAATTGCVDASTSILWFCEKVWVVNGGAYRCQATALGASATGSANVTVKFTPYPGALLPIAIISGRRSSYPRAR